MNTAEGHSPFTKATLWALSIIMGVAFVTLIWIDLASGRQGALGEAVSLAGAFLIFFAVGLSIAVRRPRHPIAWLFVLAGVYPVVQACLSDLGEMVMNSGGPATLYLVANTAFSWPVILGTLVVFVPLLFPTGRLPSPRWRWLAGVMGVAMGIMAIGGVFQRDVCVSYDDGGSCVDRITNPIGFSWLENLEESELGAVLFGVLALGMVAAGVSLIVRYRRSRGVERAQLRMFGLAAGLFLFYMLVVGVLIEEVLGLGAEVAALAPFGIDLFGVFLALVPISVGLAILRYRLYDIDRLISRTVSYGLISAVLLLTYAGGVFFLRRVLPGQSDLAVAASTLAVAALFNPVRRKVQSAVDRRFNRSRYDASRVVDAFGHRLRSEAGIENLSGELITAAATTMQPSTASLWLAGRRG